MSDTWTGSIVSVDCGDVLGVFEGVISNVDGINQTISLINVNRNSVRCQVPEVTLSTHDIKNLKLLESTVNKNENNNNNSFVQKSSILSNSCILNGSSPKLEDNGKNKGEGKKRAKKIEGKKWQTEKDEACFSAPVDTEVLDIDFDFEKNLALFDKRAVFEEIKALSKSDQVKLVDCNKKVPAKYRHDENVLSSDIPILKQISVPCTSYKEYVTGTGLLVPSVTVEFKKLIFEKAIQLGLIPQLTIESIGRSACEMILTLVGGSHRLNPENTHQKPTVIVLSGYHTQGSQGINCGRHLTNHGINVTVVCPQNSNTADSVLTNELNLFNLCGGAITHSTAGLPSSVDLIVDALDSQDIKLSKDSAWNLGLRQWTKQCKAPVLGLDPPPHSSTAEHNFILSPGLPYAFHYNKCSVHICDVGLPKRVFTDLGCTYSSPFGPKFVIPLYTTSDSNS